MQAQHHFFFSGTAAFSLMRRLNFQQSNLPSSHKPASGVSFFVKQGYIKRGNMPFWSKKETPDATPDRQTSRLLFSKNTKKRTIQNSTASSNTFSILFYGLTVLENFFQLRTVESLSLLWSPHRHSSRNVSICFVRS